MTVRLTAKEWIENRIEELAEISAVGVGGFSVMDNDLHLLVRLDPGVAQGWSDEDVVRRWGRLFQLRGKLREPLPITKEWVELGVALPDRGSTEVGLAAGGHV